MNVIMVDAGNLAGDADFPMINLNKFGWQQFIQLDEDEVIERCWRSDIIISAGTPINKQVIDKSFKLQLIVAAGDSYDHIDLDAAAERGIKVCNTPNLIPSNAADTDKLCQQVIDNINAFLENQDLNLVK